MLEELKKDKTIQNLILSLSQPGSSIQLHQTGTVGLGALLACLYENLKSTLIYIGYSEEKMKTVFSDCSLFISTARFFPRQNPLLPQDIESSGERVMICQELLKKKPLFIFSTPEAVLSSTYAPEQILREQLLLKPGAKFPLAALADRLTHWGYVRTELVVDKNQFSVRGGILDFFPVFSDHPYRLEWYGEEIDTIRVFDTSTQRSIQKIPSLEIFPTETLHETQGTLFDYLTEKIIFIINEDKSQSLYPDAAPKLNKSNFKTLLTLTSVPQSKALEWPFKPVETFTHRFRDFLKTAEEVSKKEKIYIFTRQFSRLKELLKEYQLFNIELFPSPLSQGFSIPGILRVYTDYELFGRVIQKLKTNYPSKPLILEDLKEGELVVHSSHGIARFEGLVPLEVQGSRQDYLKLEFKGNDKLYVPLEEMNLVERYAGPEERIPALSKLGGRDWKNTKAKTQKDAEEIAKEIVDLYASRSQIQGHPFSPDSPWQTELEEAFPFETTPDQEKAILETKKDMEKPAPMERLVLGDVGYGKTEVALRASFKAATDGKQVAVLVPTTILAQQHFETFSERLAAFPIKIDLLSRFKTKKEQTEILLKLFTGEIDIIIGTHRLLQKDVHFNNLGLLIIDEEQRFGVKHKEALKKIKENIDVLTLSATPIPRTLYLSLTGIRNISVIDTPPKERLPIKTYVVEKNAALIQEAVRQELLREGQIYYLCNRIEKIPEKKKELESLIPELKILVVHGKMNSDDLEERMWKFMKGFYDLLLCTTIIENGLDIPRVNTLIVEDAHRFGLGQLYQLRGRIGRADKQAYAYFFVPENKSISQTAEKRLNTIQEFTQLGSGYQIAVRDLEIRGAGHLLGLKQHGQIAKVGYHLYYQILSEEIKKLKGEEIPPEIPKIRMDLPVQAFIPSEYIPSRSVKLDFYKRLASCRTAAEIAEILDELLDRFGDPPKEVLNLLDLMELKLMCIERHIKEIYLKNSELYIQFWDGRQQKKPREISLEKGFSVKVCLQFLKSEIPVI